jgi:hypothetical protein
LITWLIIKILCSLVIILCTWFLWNSILLFISGLIHFCGNYSKTNRMLNVNGVSACAITSCETSSQWNFTLRSLRNRKSGKQTKLLLMKFTIYDSIIIAYRCKTWLAKLFDIHKQINRDWISFRPILWINLAIQNM